MVQIFKNIDTNSVKEYIRGNRWSVLIFAIAIFMLYVIGRNVVHAIQIEYESSILRKEARVYQERITKDSTLIENLKIDSELERYARENYLLQHPDEEIFIIKDK